MVDKAYDQWKDTGNNRFLRLGNLRILVSRLVSIEPYFDDSLAEKSRSQEGNYYLELAERLKNKKKSPLRELWLNRIKLNIERSKNNLSWLFTEEEFDKVGLWYNQKGGLIQRLNWIAKQILAILITAVGIWHPAVEQVKVDPPKIDNIETVQTPAIDERPNRIDNWLASYNSPMAGLGEVYVREADKHQIDWRLLPAISLVESSAGLHQRYNNAWGWNSAKTGFDSWADGIAFILERFSSSAIYAGKDTAGILWRYNGVVEPGYPSKVMRLMDQI